MTIHLPKVNQFGGGSGGGGESVEEIKDNLLLQNNDVPSVSHYELYSLKIDNKNFVKVYTDSPYSSGSKNEIVICDGFRNSATRKSSVDLSIGQSYQSYVYVRDYGEVSPNKQLIILSGINSNTNIYAIPITRSGDYYSLGTPVSFDIGVSTHLVIAMIGVLFAFNSFIH